MKNIRNCIQIALVVIVMLTLQGYSCIGENYYGPAEKETRNVSDFDAIEVSSGIDVYLSLGSRENVEVETTENIMEHLVTEVRGGKLKIYFDQSFNWNKEAKVYVQAIDINSINTSGGSDLIGESVVEATDLELKASGGSDIKLEVRTKYLEVDVSGGADIVLSGSTDYIEANSSGGSDLKAFDLIAQRAKLEASGGSDIKIYVEEELDARAGGGADINYKGDPVKINTHSSASGDVTRSN